MAGLLGSVFSIVFIWPAMIAAFIIAKPNSLWAKMSYDDAMMDEARRRFEPTQEDEA